MCSEFLTGFSKRKQAKLTEKREKAKERDRLEQQKEKREVSTITTIHYIGRLALARWSTAAFGGSTDGWTAAGTVVELNTPVSHGDRQP